MTAPLLWEGLEEPSPSLKVRRVRNEAMGPKRQLEQNMTVGGRERNPSDERG